MSSSIQIPEGFAFLREPKRYKILYGGRGGAKSHNIARTLLVMGIERPLRIVCAREIQKSIKDSVHALLSDIIRGHDLNHFYEIFNDTIRGINGTEFKFRGLKHNATDMKSLEGCDICWIEEAENVSDNSYEILIPTIRKEGSEIWISFNPKNVTDPTYRRFIIPNDEDIVKKKFSWEDNPFFPEVLNKERLRLKADDELAYNHIWEGEPDERRSGSVHGKAISKARDDGRICKCPYDPAYEVFTAWDLGFGHSTVIWFLQFVGRELHWIDYYENNQEYYEHYAKVVKEKPYNYMRQGHFLPHDGGANNFRGAAPVTQLANLGVQCQVLSNKMSKEEGRALLDNILAYSVFHEPTTKDGIFALESYHYKWDEDRGRYKQVPHPDWSEDPCDAARYAAIAANQIKGYKQNEVIKPNHPYQPVTGRRTGWMG